VNRRDRARWRTARTLADLGDLTVAWLAGEITETPGHCGPPAAETLPHLRVLAAVNKAGFITTNSQSADGPWTAWVEGFAAGWVMDWLSAVAAACGLTVTACHCRRCQHGHRRLASCPRREVGGFYRQRCPHAGNALASAWYVTVTDPVPGRNDRLWPALAIFAAEASPDPAPICDYPAAAAPAPHEHPRRTP
jgi:hypothetical protein